MALYADASAVTDVAETGPWPARKTEPIEVVDHDAGWVAAFEEIASEVRLILGPSVLEIHHVGSTSVPELCAKPRIDVDIVVRRADEIPDATCRLREAGYEFRGNRYNDGMWVFVEPPGFRRQRLYLCAPNTTTHLNFLLFRDYLRHQADAAEAYGALKRRLAVEFAGDGDEYTKAKGPFIADIVGLAGRLFSLSSGQGSQSPRT